jgi:hypothetical protein
VRALGVLCTSREVLLAVADDGALVDGLPERVQTPALYEQNEGLVETMGEIRRAVSVIAPDVVRLLLPTPNYRDTYTRIAPRAALETLVRLVGAQLDRTVELVYPTTARARLGASKTGDFDEALAVVLPEAVGQYWNRGRNRAAAAALMRDA